MRKLTRIRLYEAGIVFSIVAVTAGIIPAAIFALFIIASSQLRALKFMAPGWMYDKQTGEPTYFAERCAAPILTSVLSIVYLTAGLLPGFIVLIITAAVDYFQDTDKYDEVKEFVEDKLDKETKQNSEQTPGQTQSQAPDTEVSSTGETLTSSDPDSVVNKHESGSDQGWVD